MRIVCTSDTHNHQEKVILPDGDVFIHCGDLTDLGRMYEYIDVGAWFKALKDKYKHRIFIAGNHDFALMTDYKRVLQEHFDPDVIYLQDKGVEIDGVKFYGSPWVPKFYNWAFMRDDDKLTRYWEAIPDDTQVLMTHGPAYGILDKNAEYYLCGSRTLYERIKQLKQLKHHIFGHIHHSYGQEKIDDVTFHNVCALSDRYAYKNPPQVIDL